MTILNTWHPVGVGRSDGLWSRSCQLPGWMNSSDVTDAACSDLLGISLTCVQGRWCERRSTTFLTSHHVFCLYWASIYMQTSHFSDRAHCMINGGSVKVRSDILMFFVTLVTIKSHLRTSLYFTNRTLASIIIKTFTVVCYWEETHSNCLVFCSKSERELLFGFSHRQPFPDVADAC